MTKEQRNQLHNQHDIRREFEEGCLPLAGDAAPEIAPSVRLFTLRGIPSPCTVAPSGVNYFSVLDATSKPIASCYRKTDAELFAASTELYRALIQLEFEVSRQEGISPMLADALEDARAVLQKLVQ